MAADDIKETLTIRLPKGLKDLVDAAARSRDMTVTSVVRQALQENLYPAGRKYHPGFSKKFDAFLENAGAKRVILLVAEEETGRRYIVSGALVKDFCNDSLVAIGRSRDTPWIIPRRDIVAWYEGDLQQELATVLARQGWSQRLAA